MPSKHGFQIKNNDLRKFFIESGLSAPEASSLLADYANLYKDHNVYLIRKGKIYVDKQFLEEKVSAPQARWGDWEHIVGEGKDRRTVPVKNPQVSGDVAILDWVNFSFGQEYLGYVIENNNDLLACLSDDLECILGYGITSARERSLNGYALTWILGNDWGYVCMGGNRKTILVMISGAGCAAAKAGWQEELYEWSQDVPRFRYTRIDVAHDDFEGEYDVNMAIADYRDGAFSCGGRMPSVEQRGNWLNEKDKSGRSVYIGKRKNGKVCRVYEKGRQLGDSSNPWVRIECEWHNTRRIIPLDIVIEPGKYLAGAYPAFFWIYKTTERIRTTAKEAKILYEQAISFARQQFGKLIWYMGQVENSIQDVFDMLAIPGEPPKRLITPDYRDSILPVHAFPRK